MLLADDVIVWRGSARPTQAEIDRAASGAIERGWNGTLLDLMVDDDWREFVKPSEDVLS